MRIIESAQTARLSALENSLDTENVSDRIDAAVELYRSEREAALAQLAKAGNAEAMHRLALDLRDSREPEDIRTWLTLSRCAADLNHPYAQDELVRWYWHQKGDGSLPAIQANRAIALDYAWAAGPTFLARIGIYISGAVHQYPVNLSLGRRVMELCANSDGQQCQEHLVTRRPYDYGHDPVDDLVWLDRLARRSPERFAVLRGKAWAGLSPLQREAATARLAAWRAFDKSDALDAWKALREEILAYGAGSAGPPAECSTATPWCRGAAAAGVQSGGGR